RFPPLRQYRLLAQAPPEGCERGCPSSARTRAGRSLRRGAIPQENGRSTRELRVEARASPRWSSRGPLDERSGPRASGELSTVDDDAATRNNGVGRAHHLSTFIRVVINLHVQCLARQPDLLLRIEDDDVRIRTGRDRPLARKQAEDLRRRRGRQLDEPVQRD